MKIQGFSRAWLWAYIIDWSYSMKWVINERKMGLNILFVLYPRPSKCLLHSLALLFSKRHSDKKRGQFTRDIYSFSFSSNFKSFYQVGKAIWHQISLAKVNPLLFILGRFFPKKYIKVPNRSTYSLDCIYYIFYLLHSYILYGISPAHTYGWLMLSKWIA